MSKLLLYLLETSAVLVVLYGLYILFLRKETFFNFNRYFLLVIFGLSFLFPLLNIDLFPTKSEIIVHPVEQLNQIRISYYEALESWPYKELGTGNIDGEIVVNNNSTKGNANIWPLVYRSTIAIYALGLLTMLMRFLWTFLWIKRLLSANQQETIQGVHVIKVSHKIAPFSFMEYVFVQDSMVDSEEFDQILAHEKTHIKQRHSIDLLFAQFLAAILWFNPVGWMLIKSLKATHEYIADKKMINQGYSLIEYQTLLLGQLVSNHSFGLVHYFNLSFIKKRITMMKIEESGWAGKAKAAFTVITATLFSLLIMQCNSAFEDQVPIEPTSTSIEEVEDPNGGYLPTSLAIMMPGNLNIDNTLAMTIINKKVDINGNKYLFDDLARIIEKENALDAIILAKIDPSTPMYEVEQIFSQLKKGNQRNIILSSQNTHGKNIQVPLELYDYFQRNPGYSEEYKETRLLNLIVSKKQNQSLDNLVYSLASGQVKKFTEAYDLLVEYEGDDSFGTYLENLALTNKGLNRLYNERSYLLFNKDYNSLSTDEYQVVQKGIPNAIMLQNRQFFATKDKTSSIQKDNIKPITYASLIPINQEQEAPVPNRKPLDDTDIEQLSSAFGMRMHPVLKVKKMHLGVDFLAAMNTPVHATADGQIVQIQTSDPGEGYGNLVTIKHSKGYRTKYAHLSGFNNIEQGQEVKQGDVIGFVGSSGQSFGPHLHYEVLVNDRRVDPADYFE